jgi:hypothetical protein
MAIAAARRRETGFDLAVLLGVAARVIVLICFANVANLEMPFRAVKSRRGQVSG